MKILEYIFRPLWKSFFLLNFLCGLIVLYPFFFLLLLNEKGFPAAFRLKRFWAHWILFIPGIRYRISRKKGALPLPRTCVYCSNHVSYLDIVMSYAVIPEYFVFMGKQELDKAPLFRIFFKKMNILVNRKSRISSHKAFTKAGQELDKGRSMFLFPEGVISKTAPRLQHFKNGAFKLAIDKQVPVVPITFLNNWKILQNGGFFKSNGRPGKARIIIHPPVPTKGMTEEDLIPLRDKVYAIIDSDLKEYYGIK